MASKVFVVTGEFCFSQDGEVSWIEGVYSSEGKALVAKKFAEDSAIEEGKLVLGREEECKSKRGDWEICFEIHEAEVQ